ncbi:MAG: ATP-binding protein [Candidatus Methanoperedens sp.]|nr:ATP-binding protein [Candidatus Methanoperedens sp.]
MTKTDSYDFDIAAPDAGAMIESLRAFGYDLPTSISDLIDNSIYAGAKNVWLKFYWNGENSTFSLKDDGCGMNEDELINAMRLGSRNPLEERDPEDLGRFGLGLKTASFSQCRRLTVATKSAGQNIAIRCWDIDQVVKTGEWRLLKITGKNADSYFSDLEKMENGTVVLWENIDRIVSGTRVDNGKDHRLFLERIDSVKYHLAMVFHRFLERGRLKIWINERTLEPWDPFLKNKKATQLLNEESLDITKKIVVNPYVLPHHSKIDDETHNYAAGPKGWNAQQGFYVYRKERLIVAGSWLGLGFKKEEHYKLARIQIDIPNSMDIQWEIDVRKSIARPPAFLRDDLKRIARLTREKAAEIYRHRGKIIARASASNFVFVWEKKVRHGKIFYSLNRQHPLIKEVLDNPDEYNPTIRALIRLIEETVPSPMIAMDNSENPDKQIKPFEKLPSNELVDVMTEVYKSLLASGLTVQDAQNRLAVMEPFYHYPELVVSFFESKQEI